MWPGVTTAGLAAGGSIMVSARLAWLVPAWWWAAVLTVVVGCALWWAQRPRRVNVVRTGEWDPT